MQAPPPPDSVHVDFGVNESFQTLKGGIKFQIFESDSKKNPPQFHQTFPQIPVVPEGDHHLSIQSSVSSWFAFVMSSMLPNVSDVPRELFYLSLDWLQEDEEFADETRSGFFTLESGVCFTRDSTLFGDFTIRRIPKRKFVTMLHEKGLGMDVLKINEMLRRGPSLHLIFNFMGGLQGCTSWTPSMSPEKSWRMGLLQKGHICSFIMLLSEFYILQPSDYARIRKKYEKTMWMTWASVKSWTHPVDFREVLNHRYERSPWASQECVRVLDQELCSGGADIAILADHEGRITSVLVVSEQVIAGFARLDDSAEPASSEEAATSEEAAAPAEDGLEGP